MLWCKGRDGRKRDNALYLVRRGKRVRLESLHEVLNDSRSEGLEGELYRTPVDFFTDHMMQLCISIVIEKCE